MQYQSLEDMDPEIDEIIKSEEKRQNESLELIASENFTSVAVMQANGTILTNKYSEGTVGNRYYGGNEYIDMIESLCKKRALELFKLDPEEWDVNVQPLSGSAANLAVYLGLVGKDGKIMGLDLAAGGHLTHGFKTAKRKVSASSIFFDSKLYSVDSSGIIDYDTLEKNAKEFKPDLLICGGSAYARDFDYARLRNIAEPSYLMMDMAHISGFVSTGIMKNAFEYCDVVTTTTHKLLRGPRSGMIFYRRNKTITVDGSPKKIDIKTKIDLAVFPGLQGGPHNQKIAALAVALKQALSDDYRTYAMQVRQNCEAMCDELVKLGYKMTTNGSDCHLLLIYMQNVGANEVSNLCELVNISINKNCVPGDKSALTPSGIRVGTPALTSRGFDQNDFVSVAHLLHEAIMLAREISKESVSEGGKVQTDVFITKALASTKVKNLKEKVISIAKSKQPVPRVVYRNE
ncbi:glycine hydroxymethyltransferase [Enteropsectra breve]|nr:glycine hydroxymethyltransferase [Enteropsectra breve]